MHSALPIRLSLVAAVRKIAIPLLPLLMLPVLSFAQLPFHINSAPDTPYPGQTNFSDYDTYALASGSLMTGATIDMPWKDVDTNNQSATCPSVSFTNYDTNIIGTLVTDAENGGKLINFIAMPVSEGAPGKAKNIYTPYYIFGQAWANNLANSGTCSGITSPAWSAGEAVLPGNYILVNGVYWQETAQPWSSSKEYVGTCTTGATEPKFLSTVSSYTDKTCTWTNVGTNAPPQDACFSASYPGDGVILAANNNQAGCFNINNMPSGANQANLATGFPVSYETPMKVAWKNVIKLAISHYQSLLGTSLGYMRFGMSEGGEAVPLVSGSWPYFKNPTGEGPPSGASIVYLSYINEMMKFQNASNNNGVNGITMQADLNTWGGLLDYPDQEALYATNNNIGIGTNGLQVKDVTNINPPSTTTCTNSNANISGDWCHNFKLYCFKKMSNGAYPLCSLQTLNLSTPGNNSTTTNQVGSLSNEYWDNSGTWQGFYGLIPTAQLYGANNLEIYTCDILYTVMYSYSTNNYPGSSNCTTNAVDNNHENDYFNTFAAALDQPGIYSPAPGGSVQTDSSATLTWNAYSGAASYAFEIGGAQGGNGYYGPMNVGNVLTKSVTFKTSATTGDAIWVRWRALNSSGGVLEQADYHFVAP